MARVTSNNSRTIVTVTSQGPKGDRDQSPYSHTIHISGSEYSGSTLTSLVVTGSIIPEGDGTWDLGSETNPFRDLYITTESLKFVSKATGRVVSSLSAKNVEDLKQGKSIKDDGKQIIKGQTITGSLNVTGSTHLIGGLHISRLSNSGSYANVDFIASSSQDPFLGGTITTFDNSYHHLTDISNTYNPQFGSDSENARQFYIGNFIMSLFENQSPEINFLVSSSGKVLIGPLTDVGQYKALDATLHISGNSTDWGALLVEGAITASGGISSSGQIKGTSLITTNGVVIGGGTNSYIYGNVEIGQNCSDDILLKGNVTASCNISASGYITASNIFANTVTAVTTDLTGDVTLGSDCSDTVYVNGTLSASCDITQSLGQTSSFGKTYIGTDHNTVMTTDYLPSGVTGSTYQLFTSGGAFLNGVQHTVNGQIRLTTNTDIYYQSGEFMVNGSDRFRNLIGHEGSPSGFTFNENGANNVNTGYVVVGTSQVPTKIRGKEMDDFYTQSSAPYFNSASIILDTGRYGVTKIPGQLVVGEYSVGGCNLSQSHTIYGDITMSCNLSASGYITASNIYTYGMTIGGGGLNTDGNSVDLTGPVSLGSDCNDTISVSGSIKSLCNIRTVGNVSANSGITFQGNISGGNWSNIEIGGDILAYHITASGNISASGTITGSNAQFGNIEVQTITVEGDFTTQGEDMNILFNSGSAGNEVVTASGQFNVNYNTNSMEIGGSVTSSGILSTEAIYAPAFIETGTGTPTITSDSNLVLSASNAVVIASSPLRLRSFTNANTGSGQWTFVSGDIYFNSTTNKFMGYNGTGHVELG